MLPTSLRDQIVEEMLPFTHQQGPVKRTMAPRPFLPIRIYRRNLELNQQINSPFIGNLYVIPTRLEKRVRLDIE